MNIRYVNPADNAKAQVVLAHAPKFLWSLVIIYSIRSLVQYHKIALLMDILIFWPAALILQLHSEKEGFYPCLPL